MSLRPGSERLKHRLLEPTYSASSPGATTAACVALESSAALRSAICGVRAPPQTSALGCPWAAHARTGRCRGTPPSKTTHPPQNPARAAGTLAPPCPPCGESRTLRRQRGGALRPPPPAPPPLRPSPTSARPAARSTPPWPRSLIFAACAASSSTCLPSIPHLSVRLRGCSGGSARSRGAPERRVCVQPASQPASSSSSSNSSSSSSSSDGAPSARTAHRARVQAHCCPLPAAFRRLIRPLLVQAGAGDASEPCRVSGDRLRPAAAAIDARGGADTPLSHCGACATERLGRAWRAAAYFVVRAHVSVTESVCYEKVVPWSGKRCGRRGVPREPLMAAEDGPSWRRNLM